MFRGVPLNPISQNKKRRVSPLDRETRHALMYLIFEKLARGLKKFYITKIVTQISNLLQLKSAFEYEFSEIIIEFDLF